ncbi:MAG: zinc metallopeptidase [Granulosicoccus sp.]
MTFLLIGVATMALVLGPQLWVRWIFYRYKSNLPGMPGTGAELARHLLTRFEITEVVVEEGERYRDHFDSSTPAIRLSPDNYHGKSLTAIAVAAHEVGHAIQWHRNEEIFQLRSCYIPLAMRLQRLGLLALSAAPFLGILTRHPVGVGVPLVGGAMVALCGAATYLIVLPEEWDASFNKAMPVLTDGGYISEAQAPAVKRILSAAAITYAASALASILQVWRWLPVILKRGF